MLHSEGEIGYTGIDPRLMNEMHADYNDGIRCEAAIASAEIERLRQVEADKAEWRKRWRAMCDRVEKRQAAKARYQAKKVGKAVVL